MSKITFFKLSLMTSLFVSAVAGARVSAGIHEGQDQDGNPCFLKIDHAVVGAVQLKDACDFDLDGVGPWCDHAPAVKIRKVQAGGTLLLGSTTMAFQINDAYGSVENDGGLSFNGKISSGPDQGASLNLQAPNADEETIQFQVDMKTAKALTMTGPEINKMLEDNRGPNYQKTFESLYKTYKCSTQLQ